MASMEMVTFFCFFVPILSSGGISFTRKTWIFFPQWMSNTYLSSNLLIWCVFIVGGNLHCVALNQNGFAWHLQVAFHSTPRFVWLAVYGAPSANKTTLPSMADSDISEEVINKVKTRFYSNINRRKLYIPLPLFIPCCVFFDLWFHSTWMSSLKERYNSFNKSLKVDLVALPC